MSSVRDARVFREPVEDDRRQRNFRHAAFGHARIAGHGCWHRPRRRAAEHNAWVCHALTRLPAHKRFNRRARVVANRIDYHARFFDGLEVVAVIGLLAFHVDAVGEDDDGFAPRDWPQRSKPALNRVVKPRAFPRLHVLNRGAQRGLIVCEINEVLNGVGEGYHLDAISRLQLFYECSRSFLNLAELVLRARARVEHQHDVKRFFDGCEKNYLLLDSIFVNREIFFLKIGDVETVAVTRDDGHGYESRIELDGILLALAFVVGSGLRRRLSRFL